jgi:hypothetical protein
VNDAREFAVAKRAFDRGVATPEQELLLLGVAVRLVDDAEARDDRG